MATREYYIANRERIIARVAAWAQNNPHKVKAYKNKWRDENRGSERKKQDKYRKDNPAKYMLARARRRAGARGLDFNIGLEDVIVPQVCPLLGIPINSYAEHQDYSPSLDRIDSSRGYVKGNVHVVSFRANRVKSNVCGDELLTIAVNVLRAEGKLP